MKFSNFYESKQGFLPPQTASKLFKAIESIGGKLWVVGGAVRDFINPDSPPSKDVDLIVTNLPTKDPDKALKAIVRALQPISQKVGIHGESFGVIKAIVDGEDLDIALPREKETKTGEGHADFEVKLDPSASVEDDLARRDFTINAIASSLDGKTVVDPFGGRKDLQNKVIKAVGNASDRFGEDPLRMIRAIQFSARFGFQIHPDTFQAMRVNSGKINTIAGERVLEELKKGLTKGKADMRVLIDGFMKSGLGEEFFGNDFDPIAIDSDSFEARFIGLFFNGGDLEKAKPTNEMKDYILLTRLFATPKLPYEFIGNHKNKLDVIHEFFYYAGMDKEKQKVDKAIHTAVTPKDLVLSGQDFMEMGFKGKEIGEIQKKLLEQIWIGRVENTVDSIAQFIKENR